MGQDLVRKIGHDRAEGLPHNLGGGASEDGCRGPVTESDLIAGIRGDDPGDDGGEYIIHQVLQLGHLFECAFERGEQTGIFNGNCGLVGKRQQQVAIRLGEDAGPNAVVGVDDADQF